MKGKVRRSALRHPLSALGANEPGRPQWLIEALEYFEEQLSDLEYPCYLGSYALRHGDIFFSHVEGHDYSQFPGILSEFLSLSAQSHDRRYVLALFLEPEAAGRGHDYYAGRFWELLQFLHHHDPLPWPEGIPEDPADCRWEFSFRGTPMFVFAGAPSYLSRRSRNLGPSMVVLFQPRRVFDRTDGKKIAVKRDYPMSRLVAELVRIEGDKVAGIRTRAVIRERLTRWDGVAPHPDLRTYGEPSSNEWKQYFLPLDNQPVTGQCPLDVRRR